MWDCAVHFVLAAVLAVFNWQLVPAHLTLFDRLRVYLDVAKIPSVDVSSKYAYLCSGST